MLVGAISGTALHGAGLLALLLANPVEIVRVLAIIHLEPDLQVLGPFDAFLVDQLGVANATALLTGALGLWIALPLGSAAWLFSREEE